MKFDVHRFCVGVIIAACALGLVVLVAFAFQQHQRYEEACNALGGQVRNETTYGTGYTSDGKFVQTSNTETFCVSPDGRLLFP